MKKHKPVTKNDLNQFIGLYNQGLSSRDIAEKLDFTHTTIQKYLKLSGVQLRGRGPQGPRPERVKNFVSKPCKCCGTLIYTKPGQIKYRTYCSNRCRGFGTNGSGPLDPPILTCEQCQKTYQLNSVCESKGRRFCSNQCCLVWNAQNIKSDTKIERMVQAWLTEMNIPFETQAPIDKLIADILLKEYPIVIECDGKYWHNLPGRKQRDTKKNIVLNKFGYSVVRLPEDDILNDPDKCITKILNKIKEHSSNTSKNRVLT